MSTLAEKCQAIIRNAEKDLGFIPSACYLDLVADNLPDVPLADLRAALNRMTDPPPGDAGERVCPDSDTGCPAGGGPETREAQGRHPSAVREEGGGKSSESPGQLGPVTSPSSEFIPINVNGQMRLFSRELSEEQVRELFAGMRLRGDRYGLFAEPLLSEPWP